MSKEAFSDEPRPGDHETQAPAAKSSAARTADGVDRQIRLLAPSRLLTVKEAAQRASVCEETIRRAYHANHLRRRPFGGRAVRIDSDDLQDWLDRGGKTRPEAAQVSMTRAA
jgi:excisionase family DNA binding protein